VILFIVCCSSSSDHPIINSKNLIYDAAKATFYGLSPEETMKAITTTPASILGIADRVGAIKEGYGDIVFFKLSNAHSTASGNLYVISLVYLLKR
jgi:imidazolonepropionase-like amidohydrolase